MSSTFKFYVRQLKDRFFQFLHFISLDMKASPQINVQTSIKLTRFLRLLCDKGVFGILNSPFPLSHQMIISCPVFFTAHHSTLLAIPVLGILMLSLK